VVDSPDRWAEEHYQTLVHKYGSGADRFQTHYERMFELEPPKLVDLTIPTLREVLDAFRIQVETRRSSEMEATHRGDPSGYLAELVAELNGEQYLCGERAYEDYLQESEFRSNGIDVAIQDWTPAWKDGNVCVLGVLFDAERPEEYAR
jgi:hypothetical protein